MVTERLRRGEIGVNFLITLVILYPNLYNLILILSYTCTTIFMQSNKSQPQKNTLKVIKCFEIDALVNHII